MSEERFCRWCCAPLVKDAESLCLDCASKEAMLKEGLTTAPDRLRQDDFDRFLWKLAVYAIKTMDHPVTGPRWTIDHVRNSLALPIVKALPLNYISVMNTKKKRHDQAAEEVVFTVKAPIPKTLLYKTVEKLGIWQPIDKEEPDNFTGA